MAGDGTTLVPCAGEAHWELGVVERHGALLEDRFEKYLQTTQPASFQEWEQALAECVAGKNAVLKHYGHSPNNGSAPCCRVRCIGASRGMARFNRFLLVQAKRTFCRHVGLVYGTY